MAEPQLKELVKKRGSLKAKLTNFGNFVNLLPTSELGKFQLSELECRLIPIETLYGEFDSLQTELEVASDDPTTLYADRAQFEGQYYSLLSRARGLLASAPGRARAEASDDASTSSAAGNMINGSGCKHDFVRLPKIDLPHFDGDYQHWLEFRDTYISLIHNNTSIQAINKFHYLRAALKGSASQVIKSLDFKSDNYTIAWQLLTDRYNNENLLVNNHLEALFSFENIQKETSRSLRNMIDVTNKNLRALETLGLSTDHWDILVIHMMSKKLDTLTVREWEEFKANLNTKFPQLMNE